MLRLSKEQGKLCQQERTGNLSLKNISNREKPDDLPMVYLGGIYNMPGHGIFVGRSGKCYFGYHIDNFRELKEDEV